MTCGHLRAAIQGCEFVFLVATPMMHDPTNTKYKDTAEAIVDATRAILQQCERSKTLPSSATVHTGSVTAASPLLEEGDGYKEFVNESCWTPLDLTYAHTNPGMDAYVSSKTLCERELLKYNDKDTPPRLRRVEPYPTALKFMQALNGSVPLVHIDDVCEAHIFCMEEPSSLVPGGRYLCAATQPNMKDFVVRYAGEHPEVKLVNEEVVGEGVRVRANTNKLGELGFKYKYGPEEVLDGSVECGKRLGLL
ncbi:hypothetical protein ACQ4PT_052747 [Festuca glaucescens]